MITRYHAPIKTKLRNSFLFSLIALVQSAIFGIIALLAYIYSDSASLFWPFAVVFLILALLMFCWRFNPGKSNEAYILSDRTLAVVRPGRYVYFIKARDLRAYYPFSGELLLLDDTHFTCQSYNGAASKKEVPQALIQRWYDDSHQEALKDSTESHHTISGAGISTSILVFAAAIAAMGYAATYGHDGLGLWGQVLFGGAMLSIALPTYLKERLVNIRLWTKGVRRPVNILRIPRAKPWTGSLMAPYLLMASVLAGAFPLVELASQYFPAGPERTKAITSIAGMALSCAVYLAWRFYQRIVRGDLFTTILISPNRLVVIRPGCLPRRLKRTDALSLQTADDAILLPDGERFQVGRLPDEAASNLALAALRRKWWAHVPDAAWKARLGYLNSERPLQISLRPEDYAEATVQSDCHT